MWFKREKSGQKFFVGDKVFIETHSSYSTNVFEGTVESSRLDKDGYKYVIRTRQPEFKFDKCGFSNKTGKTIDVYVTGAAHNLFLR